MKRLPSNVVSALRTDVTITSVPQCVTELVLNAIDAKSSSIAVRVDLGVFKLQVIDNGCGISESDLQLLGNRYMTSKCHELEDLCHNLSFFGFRGEAVASLCEVSGTVVITSRAAGSDQTFCKTIVQGRHQNVVLASRQRHTQGTTIVVGDFLYNRLVRRARIKPAFDLEEIKTQLECTALIHPQISFSLKDDSTQQIILETRKSSNIVDTFGSLFGSVIAQTLCPVKQVMEPFEVSGYISKEAYTHKNLQFVYVNKRLLLKTKVHKLINSIMARSSILKVNKVPHNPISKELNPSFFLAMSPPKRAKHAVYVLNITCPYAEYDITLDPRKTLIEFRKWDIILNCIEKLVRNFLEPELSPESPLTGNSLMEEIDRLAREEAFSREGVCEDFTSNLGARSLLGLPARRDAIHFTPPSQYTPETQTSEKQSTIQLQNEIINVPSMRLTNSEDPFPPHLRKGAGYRVIPTASSEDPFATSRHSPPRDHDFNTTPQETSASMSTQDFLSLFKQPVLKKKLNQPKLQSKLPVGNPVNFDTNLRRITNMIRPPVLANDSNAVERRKQSIFDSLQKFSKNKSSQLPLVTTPLPSTDPAAFKTPENAEQVSPTVHGGTDESVPDLAHVSDLEARLETPQEPLSRLEAFDPQDSSRRSSYSASEPEEPQAGVMNEPSGVDVNSSKEIVEKEYVSGTCGIIENEIVSDCDERSQGDVVKELTCGFSPVIAVGDEINNLQNITERILTADPCIPSEKNCDTGNKYFVESNEFISDVTRSTKNYVSSEDFIVTFDDYNKTKRLTVAPKMNTAPTDGIVTLCEGDTKLEQCHGESSPSLKAAPRSSQHGESCSPLNENLADKDLLICERSLPEESSDRTVISPCLPIQLTEAVSNEYFCSNNSPKTSSSALTVRRESPVHLTQQNVSSVSNVVDVFSSESSENIGPSVVHDFDLISSENMTFSEEFPRHERMISNAHNAHCTSSNEETQIRDSQSVSYSDTSGNNCLLSCTVGTQTISPCSITSEGNLSNLNPRKRSHVSDFSLTDEDEPLKKTVYIGKTDVEAERSQFSLRDEIQEKLTKNEKAVSENISPRKMRIQDVPNQANTAAKRSSVVLKCSIDEIAKMSPKLNESKMRQRSERLSSTLSASGIELLREGPSAPCSLKIIQNDVSDEINTNLTVSNVNVMETVSTKVTSTTSAAATVLDVGKAITREEGALDVVLEATSVEMTTVGISTTQSGYSKGTEVAFGTPASSDETILEAYKIAISTDEQCVREKSIDECVSACQATERSINNTSIENTFMMSPSRDESILQAYTSVMGKDKDFVEESMEVIATEARIEGADDMKADTTNKSTLSEDFSNFVGAASDVSLSKNDSILEARNEVMVQGSAVEKTRIDSVDAVNVSSTQPLEDTRSGICGPPSDAPSINEDNWEQHIDSSGRKFFLHSISGAIRCSDLGSSGDLEEFTMQQRCQLIPKGLSTMMESIELTTETTEDHFDADEDMSVSRLLDQYAVKSSGISKWQDGHDISETSWPLLDNILTAGNDCEAPIASALVQDFSQPQIRVYNVCFPYTFDKSVFQSLRVLGQLDCKFIVTVAKLKGAGEKGEVIVLFDQHAVHERIRVEQLTKEYREGGPGIVWRSAPVHPSLPLSLSAREVRVMANCADKWSALGLRFSLTDAHSVRISGVPTCLLLREDREVHGRGVSVLKSHLERLIREQVDSLIHTRGAGVQQPAIIKDVIASEACRGAVKFGHALEVKDCEAFLHNLSSCDLPFQCAHGRPALTPIADLSQLPKPKKVQKLNLWKLRKTACHL